LVEALTMSHPYKTQPDHAFWSRSVSAHWHPAETVAPGKTLLGAGDRVVSLGSCFAANLVPYLRHHGFDYVMSEPRHPAFGKAPPDNYSYDKFSAAYGNIYTARQFRQLLDRAWGRFRPKEDRWQVDEEIIDPFRPGLLYRPRSDGEFDVLTQHHLACVKAAFEKATVVIFTLGLTEAWCSRADGAVYPACPGTVAGTFDPAKHVFHNFSVAEIADDLAAIDRALQDIRSGMRLILTVSPVPLVATATGRHVLVASTYSKSVLRVASEEIERQCPHVTYFPAYELVTGPQAPDDFFEADRRNVSRKGVDHVMAAFLARCETSAPPLAADEGQQTARSEDLSRLSQLVGTVECEELAAER
jgi:hypothetical protein